MKLYLVSRTDRVYHNEYYAFVVAANNEESAVTFSPVGCKFENVEECENDVPYNYTKYYHGWTIKENLKIECIGESNSLVEKVILDSLNA